MPRDPIYFQQIEASFRHEHGRLQCCYMIVTGCTRGGQRMLIESRHIGGNPEKLCDEAMQQFRSYVLEYVLSQEEPF